MLLIYFLFFVLFFWACRCCAVEGTGTGTGTDCPSCDFCLDDLSPQIFEFSISGVQNDVDSDCDDYNGTWQVECKTPLETFCPWWSDLFPSGEPRYVLEISKGTNPVLLTHWVQYRLVALGSLGFAGPLFATWFFEGTDVPDTDPLELVDCLVSHDLNLVTNSTACKTWPSTVTVAPV